MFSEAGTVTLVPASVTATGEFVAIQVLEDTTFTTLVDAVEKPATAFGGTGGAIAAARTYLAGTILFGRFTQIRVATGAVRVTLASRNFA
jgi:hypothetical protein